MTWILLALTLTGYQPASWFVAFDPWGHAMPGARLFVYDAHTSRPALSWRTPDITGRFAVVNPNPVMMDSRGVAMIYLDPRKPYRLVLKSCCDERIMKEWDDVRAFPTRRK